MNPTQVAIYARVSSEQQAEAHTVASQVAALRERVAADGLTVSEAMQFLDEGYSGATLVRPALERLRDVVAASSVDRLSVHSPDRLARKYAYQVLLVDEFRRAGELQLIIGRLEDFATKLHDGLEAADWASKRDLIRALVKRVEVARDDVNIVFRIDPYPGDPDPEKKSWQLCRGSDHPAL